MQQLQFISQSLFFSFLLRFKFFFLFSFSLIFTLCSPGTAKSTIQQILLFIFIITWSDLLADIRGFVCISKSKRILTVSFGITHCFLCKYIKLVWSNFNFLPNFQTINFSIYLCLILYAFCTNFQHSLTVIHCLVSYYNHYNFTHLVSFSLQRWLIVSHWSLSDSKSFQVSKTLLRIFASVTSDVVLMVSARSFIFHFPIPCVNLLMIAPNTPINTGITVSLMPNTFFNSIARSIDNYLTFRLLLIFSVVCQDGKVHYTPGQLVSVDYH